MKCPEEWSRGERRSLGGPFVRVCWSICTLLAPTRPWSLFPSPFTRSTTASSTPLQDTQVLQLHQECKGRQSVRQKHQVSYTLLFPNVYPFSTSSVQSSIPSAHPVLFSIALLSILLPLNSHSSTDHFDPLHRTAQNHQPCLITRPSQVRPAAQAASGV